MAKEPRQSRYHCASNPPPYLESVLKQLRKASQGVGFVTNRGAVRSSAAKADKEYEIRGRADDLVRFLLNMSILIEDDGDGRMFYDCERAAHVIECCDAKREPNAAADPQRRIRYILRKISEMAPPHEDPCPKTTPAETTGDKRPSVYPSPTLLSRVLYLTPSEEDVWSTLVLSVEERPDGYYLTLPFDDAGRRAAWVAEHLKCDDAFYVEMIQRLMAAPVIASLASDQGDRQWRFVRHPYAHHVVSIQDRQRFEVKQRDLDVIHALETGFEPQPGKPFGKSFEEFIANRFPDANAASYYTKMVGFAPEDRYKYWGILYRHPLEGGTVTLVCIPGFERLVPYAQPALTPPVEGVEVKETGTAAVLPQASATMPSPPPEVAAEPAKPSVEAGPISVRQLTAEDEEKRRHIIENADDERLARLIQDASTLLENTKKSLADAEAERQRRETVRREALFKRQGELTAERVSLASRLQEIDAELAEIAGKLPP